LFRVENRGMGCASGRSVERVARDGDGSDGVGCNEMVVLSE
jgi:hypothetical protein